MGGPSYNRKSSPNAYFWYEYTDADGAKLKKFVPLSYLNDLWGVFVGEIILRREFKSLAIEVGKRKATIKPAKTPRR